MGIKLDRMTMEQRRLASRVQIKREIGRSGLSRKEASGVRARVEGLASVVS